MSNLWVSEDIIAIENKDKENERRFRVLEGEPYESSCDDPGRLFKLMQREYGGCVSKCYLDNVVNPDKPQHIGWVFQKRVKFEDSSDTYIQEVWVTLHEKAPTKRTEYHYNVIR
jgi:hypothetical protein